MKKNFTSKLMAKLLVGAAIGVAGIGAASAETISFFNGSSLFATLETSGGTDFELFFNANGTAAGAYIDYIDMRGPNGTFDDNSVDTAASASYSAGGFTDAGNTYNWQIQFPNANNALRFTAHETALWSIVVTDPNAWDFSLLHVNAFNAQGQSIKLTSCVDCETTEVTEPGSLALLGLGIAGLGLIRRRRTQ